MKELLTVWTDKKGLRHIAISFVLFLLLASPFKALFTLIPGVTEIRPANALPVIFGLLWGPAGAWGTALANMFSDIVVSHSPFRVWFPGFLINFFFSYLPYRLWYSMPEKNGKVLPPSLSSVRQIIRYIYIVLLDSLVITTALGLLFEALGFQAFGDSVTLLFFNNFDFAIILGVPAILLLTNTRAMTVWMPEECRDAKEGTTGVKPYDGLLFLIAAGGILYLIMGKMAAEAGSVRFSASANWALLVVILVILMLCFGKPLVPVQDVAEEEKLSGMSIRAKVIVGFLILSVTFAVLIGATAWLSASRSADGQQYVWQYIYTVVGVALNLLFAVSLIFLRYVEKNITGPLESLSQVSEQFAERDHKDVENNRSFISGFEQPSTGDEIEKLSVSFKHMMTDITDYVENLETMTREKERIGAELNVATQIQADMLPRIFPPFPDRDDIDIYASMDPAKEVGGDFYDFFLVDENHLGIVIADVSGKGVPAALFMVIAKTLIKNHAQFGSDPADIFTITNNQLCEGNEAGLFVTAWLGVLDLKSGEMIYVNAGHNPPLLKHGEGEFMYLKAPAGFVLAGLEDVRYTQSVMKLEIGDALVLYTDGVTEAENRAKEQYGEARLLEKANELVHGDARDLVTGIRTSVEEFSDGAEQFDDITMVAFVYQGRRNG